MKSRIIRVGDRVEYRGKDAIITEICGDGIVFVILEATGDQVATTAEFLSGVSSPRRL